MAMEKQSPLLVSAETVGRAVDAILKWLKAKAKHQKAQLLEHDEFIYLLLTLKKIPANARINPFKIPLPHSLYPSSTEICLIIDDRSRSGLTSDAAKKKIASESIPISRVLKLSKLKSDYRPFEAKRKLCGSYDLFFVDKRLVPVLPRLLGKQFFKKKKIPIPIDLKHKNWKEQIENACQSALLYIRTGTCCILKVARVSMEKDEILENVMAVVRGAAEIVPKKWSNVRSLHLKSLESVALPIYQTVPDMPLKIEGLKKEVEEDVGVKSADRAGALKEKEKSSEKKEKEKSSEKKEKEKSSEKKKKVPKKGRIHEVRYLDSEMDELIGNEIDNVDGEDSHVRSGDEELLDRKNKKKMKKGLEAEDINGGHLDVEAGELLGSPTDGGEQNEDEAAVIVDKKKKKAGELDYGTPKKTLNVSKGKIEKAAAGLPGSNGAKRKTKPGKLEDKGKEVKKKASRKVK